MDKIFINIASYRDPTLVDTMREALEKCENPERIVFGLGLQYYDYEIPDLSFVPSQQIKTIFYDVDNRPGLVKIRYEISQLVTDENYFLMIDSHTKFNYFWDRTIIEDFKSIEKLTNSNKIVLTGNIDNGLIDGSNWLFKKHVFEERYQAYFNAIEAKWEPIIWEKTKSINNISCGMMFSSIEFLKEVGLDAHSQFLNEELYISWRIIMSGWKIYIPEKTVISEDDKKKSRYIFTVWNNDDSIPRCNWRADGIKGSCEMFITMLTNLDGRYSVKNSPFQQDITVFFNKKNIINHKIFEQIRNDIYRLNHILNHSNNHPINDKLIDHYLFLNKYFQNYYDF